MYHVRREFFTGAVAICTRLYGTGPVGVRRIGDDCIELRMGLRGIVIMAAQAGQPRRGGDPGAAGI